MHVRQQRSSTAPPSTPTTFCPGFGFYIKKAEKLNEIKTVLIFNSLAQPREASADSCHWHLNNWINLAEGEQSRDDLTSTNIYISFTAISHFHWRVGTQLVFQLIVYNIFILVCSLREVTLRCTSHFQTCPSLYGWKANIVTNRSNAWNCRLV